MPARYQRAFVISVAALAVVSTALLGGCGPKPAATPGAASQEAIPVLVSSDLARPFAALKAAFEQANPQAKLQAQVVPGDQLVSMAKDKTEAVLIMPGPSELVPIDQAQRLKPGSRVILAEIPLEVIVSKAAAKGACNFIELSYPHIKKIAIGDKSTGSIGSEAEDALRKAKLWSKVKDRIETVPMDKLVEEVATGKVDAAIVGAHQLDSRVSIACDVPDNVYTPIQALAVRTVGFNAGPQGRAFIKFLQSPEGRKPFTDAGLRRHLDKAAAGDELFMFVGAALREPAEGLIKAFTAKTGIAISPTYTGSGCLLAQITIGQQGDLYMPGEDYYMKQAQQRGFITASKTVSYFVPVIMVQKGNPKGIHSLADLLKPGVRVGIGEPKACAIGDFTPKVMAANGIKMADLEQNVVAHFATAPELGNSIKLDSVDAAIQWDAIASLYPDSADVVAFRTDVKTVSPIPLGILKFSQHPQQARQFLAFVSGPEGEAIFKQHGHTIDPAHPTYPVQTAAGG